MAKRIYWETIKKWALRVGVPGGVMGFAILFMYLNSLGVIDVTSYSGDSICAGTESDPCEAYINFTAKEDIFIYPMDYDPWGRNTPFETDKELESWKMYRSWGKGWREIKLNETCTGTWCGAPNNKGVKYSFVFREGRDYQIKIVAYKSNPNQVIKWGFGPVDPTFFGYDEKENKVFFSDAKIKLDTPKNNYVMRGKDRLIAEFTIENFEKKKNVFGKYDFYDLKKSSEFTEANRIEREFNYKYKEFYEVSINDYEAICKSRDVWNETNKIYDLEKYDCYNNLTGSYLEQRFNWVEFDEKAELPKGNITLGIFTDVLLNDYVEWIPTLFGVRIDEWATWTESLNVGLVAYWNFDETSGINLEDVVRSKHNGTTTNSPTWVEGKFGNALKFVRASEQYVTVLDHDDLEFGKNLTISFWVNFTDVTTNQLLIDRGYDGSNVPYRVGGTTGQGTGTYDGAWHAISYTNYKIGLFNHTIARWNGTDISLWVDGNQVGQVAFSASIPSSSAYDLWFGAAKATGTIGSFANAVLDEVGIWNRSLSDEEIVQLYNDGDGITYLAEGEVIPPYFITIPNAQSAEYNQRTTGVDFEATDDEIFDSYAVNDSRFQINSTGWFNDTAILEVKNYYINVTINDSFNNLNSTIYNVNITQNISLVLGISGTTPITYGTTTNVAGSNCPSELSCSLDKSNIVYGVGESPVTFNYSTPGNNNYSAESVTKDITINQAFPTGSLTNSLTTWTINETQEITIGRSETNNGDDDLNYIVYRDGVSKTTGETWSPALGTYDYILNTTGGENWTANANMDSETLTVLDNINPDINITSPINNTNTTNVNLDVNFSRSDVNLFNCWYSNDTYLANTTLPACGNITNVVWTFAQHNVTIWANDTSGNKNFSKITFSVYRIEENILLREVELGSNVNITVNTSLFGGMMCADIDHPDYGINYSCSSDVNIGFNISYFRKTTLSNGSSSIILNYTNPLYFNVSFINISSHQYDEVDDLRVNISGIGNPRDVTFYKVNTTDFDRVYMGYLIGSEIYLNKSCDSSGDGICVGHNNLSFPNPGSQTIYFYIDDNLGDFNFTLNVSGSLYGFEYEDTFDNDTYIDFDLTTGQLDLSGTLMPANSSYKEFVSDDFEDGDINSALWSKSDNFSFDGICASDPFPTEIYYGTIAEFDGKIRLQNVYVDGSSPCIGVRVLELSPNPTPLNMYATDYIRFNLSNYYVGGHSDTALGCAATLKVYAGGTSIWRSIDLVGNQPEYSETENMTFRLTKINTTTWEGNITGQEYFHTRIDTDDIDLYYNWTHGTWAKNFEGSWTYGTLNNTFYFSVNYSSAPYVLFENKLQDALFCDSGSQTTYIYYFNNSKWKRTNGTVTSSSVFDSGGDIVDSTFSGWGYNLPSEVITPYLSADDGTNWEAVSWGVKHTFSNPGKHLKWRIDFSNVSVAYLNKTSYITSIKINTTRSNPSNITLDFGDDKLTTVTIGGWLNSTNDTITVDLSNHILTDSFTSLRIFNETKFDHVYIIPLVVYSDSRGDVNLDIFNLTYNPNPIILNTTSIQDFLNGFEGILNFSIPIGTYEGNITIDSIQYDYAGGNDTINITIHSPDYVGYLNQTNITNWYSRWDYSFGSGQIEYLEFLPKSPASRNVTPFGQSQSISILNVTNYGYGGRNVNLSIFLNESLSCVNLTMSKNNNKSSGFFVNDSWKNIRNTSYLDVINLWMWADYSCNYTAWQTFNPFIYFRQCCANCSCSEETI